MVKFSDVSLKEIKTLLAVLLKNPKTSTYSVLREDGQSNSSDSKEQSLKQSNNVCDENAYQCVVLLSYITQKPVKENNYIAKLFLEQFPDEKTREYLISLLTEGKLDEFIKNSGDFLTSIGFKRETFDTTADNCLNPLFIKEPFLVSARVYCHILFLMKSWQFNNNL